VAKSAKSFTNTSAQAKCGQRLSFGAKHDFYRFCIKKKKDILTGSLALKGSEACSQNISRAIFWCRQPIGFF